MASIKLRGDTSGELVIEAPAVAGTNTLTLPASTSTLATTAQTEAIYNSLGVRNLIINGDMKIAQRGTSTTGITGSGIYLIDRFNISGNGYGTFTMSRDTDVPSGQGFSNSLKLDCTTANASLSASNHMVIVQRIEGQNLQHLKFGTSSAEKLTVSFWVKSNKTGTYTNEFYATDGPRHINKEFTINSADTWEQKTITIDGDTSGVINNDNGSGLEWVLWLAAGTDFTSGTLQTSWDTANNTDRASSSNVNLADSTSNYINITGVQLEVGDTATPFEHRPYDMELQRCWRYFYKYPGNPNIHGCLYSSGKYIGHIWFPTTMRTAPTVSNLTGNYNTIENIGVSQMYLMRLADNSYLSTYSADAEL